ncbi:HTH-type transcriptional regulatory protein GabR [compost metagenome]
MELHIVIQGQKDLAGQLYRQLRSAIESGQLAAGTQLPPSRLLAEQLGISRKTISDTYAQLTYESFLVGKIGSGTFVNARIPTTERKRSSSEFASWEQIEHWKNLPIRISHPDVQATLRGEFIGGATTQNQFPMDEWRRCVLHALRQMSSARGFYSQPEGIPPLREAIARHVAFSRGVICRDEDVLVCSGAQQALDLIARVMVRPGTVVAMEDPGYPPARLQFAMQGAQVVGVPVDEEGMRVELIPDATQLIYATPSHQFPLGMPMSMARREALLERAGSIGALIIEDDYDSEFRYERPTDSLQSMDRYGVVAYVGTFSKTLLPELRLGYIVLPPALMQAVSKAKQITDWHTSTLPQWALAKFMGEGYLHKHIRRCHGVYSGRRERILQRMNGDLAPWFDVVPSTAGFHMAVLFKVPVNVPLLIELAKKVEVGLYALDSFFHEVEPKSGLLMGFGAIDTLEIDPALDKVRNILRQIA